MADYGEEQQSGITAEVKKPENFSQVLSAPKKDRITFMYKFIDEVKNQYDRLVPEDKRAQVDYILGMVPFFNAGCDMFEGQAKQQEAFQQGIRAVRDKDWDTVTDSFLDWSKGFLQDYKGRLELVLDLATLGVVDAPVQGIIEVLEGENLVKNSGELLKKVAVSFEQSNPRLHGALTDIGEWLDKSNQEHPEIAQKLGAVIDKNVGEIKTTTPIPTVTAA